MNQGRIWCVVHPTVGLPLFLAGVALTSLAVHASVMNHTTWMSNYWQGAARPKVAENAAAPATATAAAAKPADAPFTITVAPVAPTAGRTETAFVITVAPNPAATVAASSTCGTGNAEGLGRRCEYRVASACLSARCRRRYGPASRRVARIPVNVMGQAGDGTSQS